MTSSALTALPNLNAVLDAESPPAQVPGTEIVSQWVQVTPTLAKAWLEANTHNRRVKEHHLSRLTHDMRTGQYLITHQGVAFDDEGQLIDGQHRLMAIVASACAQMLLVTTGLPTRAQEQMDGGARRAGSDFLGQYGRVKSGALRILLATEKLNQRVSVPLLVETMPDFTTADLTKALPRYHETFDRHLSLVISCQKNMSRRIGPSGMLAAVTRFPTGGQKMLEVFHVNGVAVEPGNAALAAMRWNSGGAAVHQSESAFLALKVAHLLEHDTEMMTLRGFRRQVIDLAKRPQDTSRLRREHRNGAEEPEETEDV